METGEEMRKRIQNRDLKEREAQANEVATFIKTVHHKNGFSTMTFKYVQGHDAIRREAARRGLD